MKKRIVSLLLAVVLVLGLMPAALAADPGDYKIQFQAKPSDTGVTGTMEDQWGKFDVPLKLSTCTLKREGYDCAGWTTDAAGTSVLFKDGASFTNETDWEGESEYGPTVNLYAIWEKAKSPEEKAADAKLTAAETAISGTYNCTWGTDTNALTMIRAKLTAAGITGVTVAMKQAEYSSYNYVGIAADGTLQYKWNENGSTPAAAGSVRPTVVLTYNDGKADYSKESTGCLFSLPLDETKAMAALNTVAARVTVPETVETADDLTSLPQYVLKTGVDASKVDYNKSDDLELWATAGWGSSPTDVISIAKDNSKLFAPYKVSVRLPEKDTTVTLTLTLTYNGREDLKVNSVYTVNVKGSQQTPAVNYQTLLDKVFGASGALTDPATDAAIDKTAVAGDIQFPTTSDIRATAGYEDFDGKYTPVYITSSDQNVIEDLDVNAARAMVYRPLPGQPDATVTVTVKILDRPTGEGTDYANMPVLASKDITLTVKALTQKELDDAAAFMSKVCTEGVYWEGIRQANTDKQNVTSDLKSFIEIVPDGDGCKFIRKIEDSKGVGVKADSIDGWELTEKYRAFRSSIPSVIASETLRVTQPEYNTPVKIDSVLTHAVYGKYYEKLKDTADGWKFAKFYKQPISTVVTVTGEKGIADPNVEKITLTVKVEGSEFDQSFTDLTGSFTCDSNAYKTAADALLAVLEERGYAYTGAPSYITSVTDKSGKTLTAGAAAHGPCSGWMYTIDGKQPELSPGWSAALDQYILQTGDAVLRFYYVDCLTDDGHHTPGSNAVTVTKEATHEEAGSRTYTCAVTWCGMQVTEVIPATGHTWGDVTYTWNERHTTCTAVRNCTANDGGEDSETANATYAVVTEPTSGTAGLGRWTAVFENEAFETQTFDVTLPATGGSTGGTAKPSGNAGKPSVRKDSSSAAAKESVSSRFDDVRSAHWFADAVEYVTENGIMNGTAADTFSPNAPATRAMLVTVLYRLAGSPDADAAHGFADLTRGAWYVDAVAWAAENGIVDGVGASRFAPNVGITREQLAVILYRYAQHCGLDVSAAEDLSGYADAQSVSPWAQAAMRWAVSAGLISGRSASALAPQSGATRAEIAQLLMSFAKLLKK
ncbi:MAG: S-layer homology domain-containing protein [Oscillospiraceae bacterium]|nr:S-layer homology domain-containing protein [Clostridiales bacterium]MDY2690991.1 S-layer homology domain-containing protein [Oscillospiraceae bacterium]